MRRFLGRDRTIWIRRKDARNTILPLAWLSAAATFLTQRKRARISSALTLYSSSEKRESSSSSSIRSALYADSEFGPE
jgi:hypothetical protein